MLYNDGNEDMCGQHLKSIIARRMDICECRLDLAAGNYRVRVGTPMARILKWMQPRNIMYAIRRSMHASGSNAADLIADGFCLRCMKEAGVQAYEILALPRDFDAGALKAAGYSLKELLCARARLPLLYSHPPVTNRTLFDSQLQRAGYSAKEFLDAGFAAGQLSYNKFMCPSDEEELTPGEKEWEATCAFFTATQLREANYTEMELRCAGFSDEELREADYVEDKLLRAVPAKAMPRSAIRKNL